MAEQIGLAGILDLKQFDKQVSSYLSSVDKAVSATEKGGSGMGRAWGNLGSAVTKTSLALGATAVGAATAATAAVTAFTVGGINKAKDLQAQMSNIAAVLNKTAAEAAPLKDLIISLGINPALKVNATEAANAIEMLARNGLSMQEIMDGAAYSTVLLANATGADFGTAANIATDAMAIFKIEAKDMATAVNGISSVTTNSKFDINDYALALQQGGGVASAVGVSFEDFNTTIAAISPLFGSGSDAGTSFKTMLSSMNPKSKEAAQWMDKLGISFYDAQGNMKSMSEIATELNDAFLQEVKFSSTVSNATAEQNSQRALLEKTIQRTNTELYKYSVGINGVAQSEADKAVSIDRLNREHDAAIAAYQQLAGSMGTTVTVTRQLSEAEKSAALNAIFGTDASRTAIALAESGNVVYTDLATAVAETGLSQEALSGYMEDGALTAFELLQAQQSLTDAQAQAKTRMDNFAGAMEILSGIFEAIQLQIGDKFLPILQKMAEALSSFVESHSDDFVAFFDNIAAGVEAVFGAAQVLIQFIQTGEQVSASEFGLGEQTAALADSFVDLVFHITDTITNIGLMIQPIIALVGKFVEWKDIVIVLGAALVTSLGAALLPVIASIATVTAIFVGAVVAVAALRTAWETNFLGIRDTTLAVFAAVQEAIQPAIIAFQTFGQGALAEIWAFVNGNETAFTNLGAIWEGVKESVANLFTALNTYIASVIPGWTAIMATLANIASIYIAQFRLVFNSLIGIWNNAVTLISSAINGEWAAAFESAQAIVSIAVTLILGTLQNFAALAITVWGPLATAAWQWIVDAIPVVQTQMAAWFTAISTYVAGQLPNWIAALGGWATAAWQWIADAALLVGAQMLTWLGSLTTFLTANLTTFESDLTEWATAAWQWIADASDQVAAKMLTWLTALTSFLTEKLTTFQGSLTSWADTAWQWIVDAASQIAAKMLTWLSALTTFLSSNLSTFTTGFLAWTTAAWQWIVDATSEVAGKMQAWLTALTGFLTTKLQTFESSFLSWTTTAWQWIVNATGLLASKMFTWLSALTDFLTTNLNTFTTAFLAWTLAAWEWIVKAAGQVAAKLGEWYTALSTELSKKLATWKTSFEEWKTASVDWLAGSTATIAQNVGAWYTDLTTSIGGKKESFRTLMLGWATTLVSWITDKAADALPHLGTWLGKIFAWIPLAAIGLAVKLAQLIAALVNWIASDPNSAATKTDPELAKFQTALSNGLTKVGAAIVKFVQNFATEWWNTMNEYVDWQELGAKIMGKLKLGIISLREAIQTVIQNLAQSLYDLVFNTDWLGLGKALVNNIKQGVIDVTSSLTNRMYLMAVSAANKFISYDWLGLGKDVIAGILKGLKEKGDDIVDYLFGLGEQALDKIKEFFGIASPSKVMAELGRDIIQGWLDGMKSMSGRLYYETDRILNGVYGRIEAQQESALASLDGAASAFMQVADSYRDPALAWIDDIQSQIDAIMMTATDENKSTPGWWNPWGELMNKKAYAEGVVAAYDEQKDLNEELERQVRLVNTIQSLGGNVYTFLGGMKLGRDANPAAILDLTTRAAKELNLQLEKQLQIAEKGYNVLVDTLRAQREDIHVIEGRTQHKEALVGLELYKNQVLALDDEIAKAETQLLNTGSEEWANHLRTLNVSRQKAARELEVYATQWNDFLEQFDIAGKLTETFESGSLSAGAVGAYFAKNIGPLYDRFQDPNLTTLQRQQMIVQLYESINKLNQYKKTLAQTTAEQDKFTSLLDNADFGDRIEKSIQPAINALFDINITTSEQSRIIGVLENYRKSIANVVNTLGMVKGGGSFLGDLVETYVKPLAQQLMNINLSAEERNRLTQEYIAALGKARILETRENAVALIQDRIDLMTQITEMAGKLGDKSLVEYILGSANLKTALSPTQLADIMTRYSEVALRLANKDLLAVLNPPKDYSTELGKIVDRAVTYEDILKEFDHTQVTPLEQAKGYLDYYDQEIAKLRDLAATGNQTALASAKTIMGYRDRIVQVIRTYMDALYRADQQIGRLQKSSNDRAQETAQNYIDTFITPLREQIADSFSESYRASLVDLLKSRVDKVNAYVVSIEKMGKVEADIAKARELNPLMGMLAAERIDPLLEKLYDVNTAESERVKIYQQLVAEQQKLVDLQQKQQQLDFLQYQLDILNQVKQLNDTYDKEISMENILKGIKFGFDASLDDMLTLTSRVVDAFVTTVKKDLGISSPSKVFYDIGQYVMAGLTKGINDAARLPMQALSSASAGLASQVINNRTVVLDMGGVAINNGMDMRAFEQRVRYTVENMIS